jgi:hypothetical protein
MKKKNIRRTLGRRAWLYLKEIGHNWTFENEYDQDCDLSYLDEAIEHGWRSFTIS